jgi:hypothetical protein
MGETALDKELSQPATLQLIRSAQASCLRNNPRLTKKYLRQIRDLLHHNLERSIHLSGYFPSREKDIGESVKGVFIAKNNLDRGAVLEGCELTLSLIHYTKTRRYEVGYYYLWNDPKINKEVFIYDRKTDRPIYQDGDHPIRDYSILTKASGATTLH